MMKFSIKLGGALIALLLAGQAAFSQVNLDTRIFPALVHVKSSGANKNGEPFSAQDTGFLISSQGHILTVEHVLSDISSKIEAGTLKFSIQIGPETDELGPQSILLRDIADDLMILKVPTPTNDRKFLCFLPKSEEPSLGNHTEINSSGYPDGVPYINTHGIVSATDGPGITWLTDLRILPGQSGAPVYLSSGKVVGIAKGEHEKLQGIYAFIPITNMRSQISNFSRDCATEEKGAVEVSLPLPSECVFLGKLSALKTEKLADAPFGQELLHRIADGKLPATESFTATAKTAVNVRSTCPVIRDVGTYYGTITRSLPNGQSISIRNYAALHYLEDTFYWGRVGPEAR